MTTVGVILCFDLGHGCWECEESLPREPVEERYCSVACADDAQERRTAEMARVACCPECGYDRQEHSEECSRG